jgi:hypothetical protein
MFKTYVNASAGVAGPGGMSPVTSPSAGRGGGASGWNPSVTYMIALIVAEVILVGFISKKL